MDRRLTRLAGGLWMMGVVACAGSPPPAPSEAPGPPPPRQPRAEERPAPPGEPAVGEPSEPDAATPSVTASPFHDRAPEPRRGLPAISVRHVGMHIGGGTNSAEEKRPFLGALEAIESELLRCYREVERPLAGGTFGVDLLVPAAGGHPEVRGARQRLGGPALVSCMEKAFARARFPAPGRATMVSYSLRFDVTDPTR